MSFFVIGAIVTAGIFCLLGPISGKVKSVGEYATAGRKARAGSVTGVVMGALVSGGSTVGTVQMAYQTGISGWWFTLGSGLSCAILALWFARPVRASGLSTLPEFIERSCGRPTALLTLAGSAAGTLLSVAAQFMAGLALLCSAFPISQEAGIFILALVILFFIFTGGLKSFSLIGSAKVVILYLIFVLCAGKTFLLGQTPQVLIRDLPFSPWLNLLGRGVGRDLGACVSLIVGVLCTQIYLQAVFSASDEKTARRGCLVAAFLIPPLGLMGVWIGLGLRNAGVVVEPAQALPWFLSAHFHPVLAGVMWAGLLITAIGGAAGLILGLATNLSLDLLLRIPGVPKDEKNALRLSRWAVFLSVLAAALLALVFRQGLILHLSYLALSLRATGMIIPLVVSIFRPGLLSPRRAFVSSLCGLGGMLIAWIFFPNTEPLFIGLLAAVAGLLICRPRPDSSGSR
ncbi:MAG: sodium:solute symporter family protein [Synergistaceae bacterium]|jgi:SSS family solute:Na+ symporter|nr:sodium:solute symporter family protein [Synergistaceae bacterium]